MASLLQIREGVTQGCVLAMVTYGIRVFMLINQPKSAYPVITQFWYSDNLGALGTNNNTELCFNSINNSTPIVVFTAKPQKSF